MSYPIDVQRASIGLAEGNANFASRKLSDIPIDGYLHSNMVGYIKTLSVRELRKVMRYIGKSATWYNRARKDEMVNHFTRHLNGLCKGHQISPIWVLNLVRTATGMERVRVKSLGQGFGRVVADMAYEYGLRPPTKDRSGWMLGKQTVTFDSHWELMGGGGGDPREEEDDEYYVVEDDVPEKEVGVLEELGEAGVVEERLAPEPEPAPVGSLEAALGDIVKSSIGTRVEEELTKRGITKESVEETINKHMNVISAPTFIKTKGDVPELVHPMFARMMNHLKVGLVPFLKGPAGSGKTHAAQQLATMLERPCTVISCHKKMTTTSIVGYRNAVGDYIDTAFYRAFHEGHVLIIDEADKAPGDVNVSYNSLIANDVMMFPDGEGTVNKHEDTILVFTGNTRMSGASAAYNTGQRQDESLKNRMSYIEWGYDNKLEKALVRAECTAYDVETDKGDEWLSFVRSVRKQIDKMGLNYVAGPRQSMAGVRLLSTGMTRAEIEHDLVYGWMRPEDAKRIKEAV